jgi:hypothetical protein
MTQTFGMCSVTMRIESYIKFVEDIPEDTYLPIHQITGSITGFQYTKQLGWHQY